MKGTALYRPHETPYLLLIDLFNTSHCLSQLLLLSSEDDLSSVDAGWWDIYARSSLLHDFTHQLVERTSNKRMVYFLQLKPLYCTLILENKITFLYIYTTHTTVLQEKNMRLLRVLPTSVDPHSETLFHFITKYLF